MKNTQGFPHDQIAKRTAFLKRNRVIYALFFSFADKNMDDETRFKKQTRQLEKYFFLINAFAIVATVCMLVISAYIFIYFLFTGVLSSDINYTFLYIIAVLSLITTWAAYLTYSFLQKWKCSSCFPKPDGHSTQLRS